MKLATICYIDNGSQFLLLHRNKRQNDIHKGKWVSVGGKFEPGETPEACAKREIFEETGLIAEKMELCGFITFPNFTQDGEDWYSFVYRVTEFSGELQAECPEGTLSWVDYDEIINKPTWEGDYIFLSWVLEKSSFFSANFTYENDKLIEHFVEFYDHK
ncbi:8-oxo-dGTP diphosphatase [Aerococcaceae bacterium zg-ZUI334]|uniref:NUDIX hydrolase n=1 Tax=Aerococcaceae bacterium zg-252 TaxID=2796928 RepID=UPI001B8E4459|nr:8-oxo-dGTP diphosphatase [Aerococcaceae bacterium zg-ZUI334]